MKLWSQWISEKFWLLWERRLKTAKRLKYIIPKPSILPRDGVRLSRIVSQATLAEGEHLVYGEDLLSPGHILNAYTVGSRDDHCDSFIISKIKQARPTDKKFTPRNNWQVEF